MPKNTKMHNKLILVICLGLIVSLAMPISYNADIRGTVNKGAILKTTTLKVDKKIITPNEYDINLSDENIEPVNRGAMTVEEQIVTFAKEQVGKKYVWGASGENVFGTLGLVKYVYSKYNIDIDDSIEDIYNNGEYVGWDNMAIGDLVFFAKEDKVDHIGIFIGNGDFIHVTTNGVIVSSLLEGYYSDIYSGAVKIIK